MKTALFTIVLITLMISGCNLFKAAPKPVDRLVAAGVTVEGVAVGGMSQKELYSVLQDIAKEQDQAPENAKYDNATGAIVAEKQGKIMDITATADSVMAAAEGSRLSASCRKVAPELTSSQLNRANVIGSFVTHIIDRSPGRLENIRLTAQLINNTLLGSGDEFSFNGVTGEPTADRGFKNAAILAPGGAKVQGIGGGMCQVSSTLYNAVLAAGLPVTERHPHSQPVDYVPADKDATTFTDKDFRFVNNTRSRIIIRACIENHELKVDLLALPNN